MTIQQATAQVFWTAFKSLPRSAREDFLGRLVDDRRLRRELEDKLDNESFDRAFKARGRISWESLKRSLKR